MDLYYQLVVVAKYEVVEEPKVETTIVPTQVKEIIEDIKEEVVEIVEEVKEEVVEIIEEIKEEIKEEIEEAKEEVEEIIEEVKERIEEIKAQVEIDRLEKERKAEEEQIATEKRAERNKKIAIITTSIFAVCIASIIVLIMVIIPYGKYKKALALYNENKFDEFDIQGYKNRILFLQYLIDKL